MTVKQIKSDLAEIKFYYANQSDFDIAAQSIGESAVYKKVKRYNEAVANAPAELYRLYVALYVNGSTQLDYALDEDKCVDSICRYNKKLQRFFADYFDADYD